MASVVLAACAAVSAAEWPPLKPASWARANGGFAVLNATEDWEKRGGGACVCENVAMLDEGKWVMYYRGGWAVQAVGVAFSENGVDWVKGNNKQPVLGGGGSGVTTNQAQPWVVRVDSTKLRMYTTGAGATLIWQSADGMKWMEEEDYSVPLPPDPKQTAFGNRHIFRDPNATDANVWKMYQEIGQFWEIYLLGSADGLHWSYLNDGRPLKSLSVHGGSYSGPRVVQKDGAYYPWYEGAYHMFYHGTSTPGSVLPTDIFHAESQDMINWKVTPNATLLTHRGPGTFEYDQVAGPVPVVVNGTAYLFYDGDENTAALSGASIGLAMGTG